jgi:hypothetical protein
LFTGGGRKKSFYAPRIIFGHHDDYSWWFLKLKNNPQGQWVWNNPWQWEEDINKMDFRKIIASDSLKDMTTEDTGFIKHEHIS